MQTFEMALHLPVEYSIKVSIPDHKFRLTQWEYECPAAPDVFCKSIKEDMQDIVIYVQQLDMAQRFHFSDMKLLLAAVTKHF